MTEDVIVMLNNQMITSRAEVKRPELKYQTMRAKEITIHLHDFTINLSNRAAKQGYDRVSVYWTNDMEYGNLMVAYYKNGRMERKTIFQGSNISSVEVEYEV